MKRVPTIAALLLALALTACGVVPGGQGSAGQGSAGQGTGGTGATASKLAEAKTRAAQYDYDAALALIAGDTSQDAQQAKAEIEKAKSAAQAWTEPNKVPHLFWHPLVIDPQRAFHSSAVRSRPARPHSRSCIAAVPRS